MNTEGAASRRRAVATCPPESRIPLPHPHPRGRAAPGTFRGSSSVRLRGERMVPAARGLFPAITEADGAPGSPGTPGIPGRAVSTRHRSLSEEGTGAGTGSVSGDVDVDVDGDVDGESLWSTASASACFARNGTTFSGRRHKYVVHCSPHGGLAGEYLTPTQRANRHIRRLKALLQQTQKDLQQKDHDIVRLTKEVVELRLLKASLAVAGGNPMRDVTDREVPTGVDEAEEEAAAVGVSSPLPPQEVPHLKGADAKTSSPSLSDSGHFEDMATPGATPEPALDTRLHELQEWQLLKDRHSDRVDALLGRLTDANNRYCQLRCDYQRAQERLRQLERETESLRKSMEEHEERHRNTYLKMYIKGQEAARFEHAGQVLEFAHHAPTRVSVPELLQQLQVTENELENIKDTDTEGHQSDAPKCALLSAREAVSLWLLGTRKAMYRRIVESRARKGELDPEITLQFLKSAIYYFLTDKENHQGHLNAIESILGYSDVEKHNIEKAYRLYPRK